MLNEQPMGPSISEVTSNELTHAHRGWLCNPFNKPNGTFNSLNILLVLSLLSSDWPTKVNTRKRIELRRQESDRWPRETVVLTISGMAKISRYLKTSCEAF